MHAGVKCVEFRADPDPAADDEPGLSMLDQLRAALLLLAYAPAWQADTILRLRGGSPFGRHLAVPGGGFTLCNGVAPDGAQAGY
jgi:hypothetical protein